jgi:hypothetical protein
VTRVRVNADFPSRPGRVAKGGPSPLDYLSHGTWAGYTRGCRCGPCQGAQHERYLARRSEYIARATARYRRVKAAKSVDGSGEDRGPSQ